MASLFDRLKKKSEEIAQGVYRQVNPFDGGKTYSNPNPQPQPQPQPRPQINPVQQRNVFNPTQPSVTTKLLSGSPMSRPSSPTLSQPKLTQPSYGTGLTGVLNRAKDIVDPNTPQDMFKRNQTVKAPFINQTYQQQQATNPNAINKMAQAGFGAVNRVASPVKANIDLARAGAAQLTGNQQARNNAFQSAMANSKVLGTDIKNFASSAVESPRVIGRGLAALSPDQKNAEKAQQAYIDQLNQQKLNAINRAKQGFNTQQDINRFTNYADNLWNNEYQARQQQIQGQQEKYKTIDPVRQAAAIADTGLTATSFLVAGATKKGAQAAASKAFEQSLAQNAPKELAMQTAKRAGTNEIIRQSALTGSMSGAQGVFTPYATKDPGTVTPKDVISSAAMNAVLGGLMPGTAVGLPNLKNPIQNTVKGLTKENLGAISPRLKLNNQIGAIGRNVNDSVDPLEALKAEARKNGEVIVYHRTSKANADQIMKTGKMFSKENTGEIFTSNRPDGQISGYGDTVVPIRVKKSDLRLDDEFPTGEKHFAIKSNKATPVTDLYNQATKPSRLNPFKDQVGAIGKNIRDDSSAPIEKTPKTERLYHGTNRDFKQFGIDDTTREARKVRQQLLDERNRLVDTGKVENGALSIPKNSQYRINAIDKEIAALDARTDILPSSVKEKGVYFTTDKKYAQTFAGKDGKIVEADVELNNPYIIKSKDEMDLIEDAAYYPKIIDNLESQGYDGIKAPDGQVLVFNPQKARLVQPPAGAPIEKTPTQTPIGSVSKVEKSGTPVQTVVAPAPPKTKTRVVPQISEEANITKAQPQKIVPPQKPPTDTTPPQLGPGKTKATRFADKTIPESEFVSDKIKGTIKSPEYNVQTERQGYMSSVSRLKAEGDAKFENNVFSALEKKNGTISRQEAIDAQTYAAVLDGGDDASIRKATQIYERLSEHYTAAGQLTQAAAIMARRTPDGLRQYATKTLKNAGVKMTPELEQQLTKLVQAVREASPDTLPKAQYQVMDFVAKQTPTSFGDKVINTWRAGLLTAPTTTGGNLLGNTGEALVRKGFVNPVATATDALIGQFTGKRTMSLAKGGAGAKGVKEGTGMLGDYLKTGYDPRMDNIKYDAPRRINTGIKALDTYINGTYRLMGVADMPFSSLAEKEALSSIAKAEAINKGLKGKAKTDFVNEFMKNPPETALARAQKEADYATFKNPTALGKAATGFKRPLGAVGDFVVPFTQVPASIATRIVERTPIGTANNIIKQIVEVRKGGNFDQRALSQSVGNGMFGPAVIGVGYALAENDLLTYGYPKDDKERKLWDSEGKQPYSVRVGDRWYSLNYLQPFGTLLAIGGQARQAAKEGKKIDEIVGQGFATAGQSVMNQSFLKGIGGALDAISDPERSVRKYVENTTSSVVPNFVRSYARASDPLQREPVGISEGVKSGIPGLRESTTPKMDIFGKPLTAKDNFANQYLNPLKPSKVKSDPTIAELRRLKDANLGTMPTEADSSVFGKDNKLDKKQLNDLNAYIGQRVGESWKQVIASKEYNALPDDQKKKVLDATKKDYAAVAKAEWAAKNNKISDAWQPDLTKKQQEVAQGNNPDYMAKAKENAIKGKYSQEVQDFSKLSNTEKNAYFKRDPKKAKQLYDESKKMEAELGVKPKTTKTTTKKVSTKKSTGRKTAKAKKAKLPKFVKAPKPSKIKLTASKPKVKSVSYKATSLKGIKPVKKLSQA